MFKSTSTGGKEGERKRTRTFQWVVDSKGKKHLLDKWVMETGRYSGSKFSIGPPSLGGREHVIP